MTYKLIFLPSAKKEWDKLDPPTREQLKKKLTKRLENPRVPKDKLSEMKDCYKIKLRDCGYRLVYQVIDHQIIVQVIAIGSRDEKEVYAVASARLH